jgi:catechol 2,3-dioxygenase-like lactoylglutathione lyase family enzyme
VCYFKLFPNFPQEQSLITGIDHIVLVCASLRESQAIYETLLGRTADWTSKDSAGSASAFFQLSNVALEIMAPQGDGPMAQRIRELLDQYGPGLQTLVLASDNLEDDRRIFERRALQPDPIQAGESTDLKSQATRHWQRFRIKDTTNKAVRILVLQRADNDPLKEKPGPADTLSGLDHLVINTFAPERAVALYGARLGLRLALDLTMAERDARLLSFKAGQNTIELSHRISKANESSPDNIWGITWRTTDIIGAHARMAGHGLNISEIRQGMRKGTKVFTVRDHTINVPTLILSE